MMLPPGWESHDLSAESSEQLMRRASLRLAQAHRPDLLAQLSAQVEKALAALKTQDAFAYAFAGEASPTWSLGPASLVGIVRVGTDGAPLDAVVREAIMAHDGVAVGEGHQIVRWVERRPVRMDDEDLVSTMVNYLIPVPGTRRTQAVQWTVTVPHPADMPIDHPAFAAWIALFDGHVATFEWTTVE